ncbi:response regulator [Flavisolibacter nicotianae]|uniref:response regulator n=1 Tax=Flavisolibacter nicotianae TaxID=2364882 RepID=UPI0013C498F7|nr:response regulator [Flavisolibacter nicotianae]
MITFRVLVVDDDPDDRDLLREALEEAGIEPILSLAYAHEVFSYLQGVEQDEDLPVLIVTDLNMQGISGLELLCALKGMQRYQHIAVVVYSTSSHAMDVRNCLTSGASEYITKPNSISGFPAVTAKLKEFVY